jgi:hypothetical protein
MKNYFAHVFEFLGDGRASGIGRVNLELERSGKSVAAMNQQ